MSTLQTLSHLKIRDLGMVYTKKRNREKLIAYLSKLLASLKAHDIDDDAFDALQVSNYIAKAFEEKGEKQKSQLLFDMITDFCNKNYKAGIQSLESCLELL
jgi:hypothetical protein